MVIDYNDDALQWERGPFLFVPSALGLRQSAPPGAEKRAPEGSSLALAQFPPSHVGRESPQSLSARHGDDDGCPRTLEHAQSLLVSSGLALQLYARPNDGQSFFLGDLGHVNNLFLHHWDWHSNNLLNHLLCDSLLGNHLGYVHGLLHLMSDGGGDYNLFSTPRTTRTIGLATLRFLLFLGRVG